jgi:hypothetical protein
MGALIGLAVQLTMLAIGLMITLVILTVRLTIMLIGALFAMVASATRERR